MIEGDGRLTLATVRPWTWPCCLGLVFLDREDRILFHLVGFVSALASEQQELKGPIHFCLSVHLFILPPSSLPFPFCFPQPPPACLLFSLLPPCGPHGKEVQTGRRPGAVEALWDWEQSGRWNGAPFCCSF